MNKRQRKKLLKQHNLYVNPNETYSLDITIANFILPRLKLFKKLNNGFPSCKEMDSFEKWNETLDKMINAFELISCGDSHYNCWDITKNSYEEIKPLLEQKQKEVDEGLWLFSKWFQHLWW